MKTIYQSPELRVLETVVQDVITASAPVKVSLGGNNGVQENEETGTAWGSMW